MSTGRKGAVLGAALVALLATTSDLLAQKKSARPQARPGTTTTTYRYAYQHGYRGGYDDGFTRGRGDFIDSQSRDFTRSDAYQRAERGYEERMGALTEYQDGYRIGFEVGYNDGYLGRTSSPALPANLSKMITPAPPAATVAAAEPPSGRPSGAPTTSGSRRGPVNIPDGVQMKIRLTSPIDTKVNKQGDQFTAVVLDPSEYAEAMITGHIAKLSRSGKATGKTELALSFDTIQLRDGRTGKMAAQVERVYESKSVKTVDEEGNVESSSQTKDTAVRGAGVGALGAIIGGIAGGGKGAAIGAIVGAAAGAGSVFVLQGGKDVTLDPGAEMLIRTAAPARASN